MTKNSFSSKLVGVLGICLLTGCISPQPVQRETIFKSAESQDPVSAVVRSAHSPLRTEANTELTGKIARETHDEECVFFSLGSSALSNKEKHKIDTLAQRMLDDKNLSVTLIGHANDNGSSSFNLAVSDSRVMAVAEQLRKYGVLRSQIRKEALGSERTPKSCRSEECRLRSRRVEFVFSKQR